MFVHEAIDALGVPFEGPKSLYDMPEGVVLPGRKGPSMLVRQAQRADWPAADGFLKRIRQDLLVSSPFRFENVPIDRRGNGFVFPAIGDDGMTVFNDGDAEMPEDVCWFEVPLGPRNALGLLLVRQEPGFTVVEFSRSPDASGTPLLTMLPYRLRFAPTFGEVAEALLAASETDPWTFLGCGIDDPLSVWPRAVAFQRRLMSVPVREQALVDTMVREPIMAIYCLLVLRSYRRSIELVQPKTFANRRRREKGLTPVPTFRSVAIAGGWRPGELPQPVEQPA